MSAITLGSCRSETAYSTKIFDHIHSSKEIVQILKWTGLNLEERRKLYIPELVLVNRTYNDPKKFIQGMKNIRNSLKNSNILVIEISSLKSVKYNNLYLQLDLYQCLINKHPKHIKRFSKLNKTTITTNTIVTTLTKEDLIEDLNFIVNHPLLKNTKIVFIPHVNVNVNSTSNTSSNIYDTQNLYIKNRQLICKTLEEFCKQPTQSSQSTQSDLNKRIIYFNPMTYLEDDPAKVFVGKGGKYNYGHYNKSSATLIRTKLGEVIKGL